MKRNSRWVPKDIQGWFTCNIIALTSSRRRFAEEAIISWYVRRAHGSCSHGPQMHGKGNHNFQLFLSYAWPLHHPDNIVLHSRARYFLVPAVAIFSAFRYLRISRWLYTAKAAPDFSQYFSVRSYRGRDDRLQKTLRRSGKSFHRSFHHLARYKQSCALIKT